MRQSGLLPSEQLEIFFGSCALNRRYFLGSAAASAAALHPAFTLLGEQAPRAAPLPEALPGKVATGGLDRGLIERAREALARHGARIVHRDVMAVADFSLASNQPRLHLVDLIGGQTTTLLVAHGRGSDPGNTGWLERFSNRPGSNASSRGSFLTGDAYSGKHGRSRKLIGLGPDNNEAERRAIVIHAAGYVSRDIARDRGRIGRSQGCFAVSQADLAQVMARLGPGRLLYAGKA
jgi:L,D-transpeptidase catalytic domain